METLKQHRTRPLLRYLDQRDLPAKVAVAGLLKFKENQAVPEDEALWFYLRNHAMSVIARAYDPAEPLSPKHLAMVNEYHDHAQQQALRMHYYLMQICCRETRHASNTGPVVDKYTPALATWFKGYKGNGSGEQGALNQLRKNPPDATFGEMTRLFSEVFYKASFSGGFGGKPWGGIADVLKQFCHGEITAEMMLDTAFTLCHNNGPIFNKGMLYGMYHPEGIKEILDVQRAGMIPRYVRDVIEKVGNYAQYKGGKFVTKAMHDYVLQLEDMSAEFNGSVDWAKLKELGALGNYSGFAPKAPPKPLTPAEKMKIAKAKADAEAALAAQYQITPGVFATKVKVPRVAA